MGWWSGKENGGWGGGRRARRRNVYLGVGCGGGSEVLGHEMAGRRREMAPLVGCRKPLTLFLIIDVAPSGPMHRLLEVFNLDLWVAMQTGVGFVFKADICLNCVHAS